MARVDVSAAGEAVSRTQLARRLVGMVLLIPDARARVSIARHVAFEVPVLAKGLVERRVAAGRNPIYLIVLQGTKESELALLICEVQGGR